MHFDNRLRRFIAGGLIVLLNTTRLSPAASMLKPHFAVEPANLNGMVLFSDGATPVTRLPVRVWDSQNERSVYRTETTTEGVFSVPRLNNGRYFLIVGELAIDMEVFTEENAGGVAEGIQQSHDIVIVIPRRAIIGMPSFQSTPLFLAPLIHAPTPTRITSP